VETRQAIRSFILDREARNISPRTVQFYEQKLGKFCARYAQVPEAPDPIREFLRDLTCGDETKHGYFRALKALYSFLELEYGFPLEAEPKSPYANPIRKIKAPRVKPKVMRSLGLEEVHRLLNAKEVRVPLVVHGGTGLPPDYIERLISVGGSKFNVSTELKYTLIDSTYDYITKNRQEYDPGKIDVAAKDATRKAVM